jgi:membrane-associated phospholipid phosphatase
VVRTLAKLDALDRRLFDRLTRREPGLVAHILKPLSASANQSGLWLTIAAALALGGGQRNRRAALRGVVSIAITSALVNLPMKYLARRGRPSPRRGDAWIRMPRSSSFPSGHAASAFAFATGVTLEQPLWAIPTLPLAVGVAYSRVGLRVHYPFDVLAGAAIGSGIGMATGRPSRLAQRWLEARAITPTGLSDEHP